MRSKNWPDNKARPSNEAKKPQPRCVFFLASRRLIISNEALGFVGRIVAQEYCVFFDIQMDEFVHDAISPKNAKQPVIIWLFWRARLLLARCFRVVAYFSLLCWHRGAARCCFESRFLLRQVSTPQRRGSILPFCFSPLCRFYESLMAGESFSYKSS